VKFEIPLAVGTPEMVPADAARVSPWGSLPEVIDHEYGAVPPTAFSVFENGVPIVIAGSVEGAMASGVAVMTTVRAADAVCAGLLLSVTVAVKDEVPLADGTPEMVPVDEVSVSPAGRLPEVIDHEYGAVPPVACRVCEYAVPTTTEGSVEAEILTGVGATITWVATDTDCAGLLLSVTVAVKEEVPLAVGIPEMLPVGASVSPEGRLPDVIDHEYGAAPPVACNACEYVAPTVAELSAGVAMVSGVDATEIVTGADVVCIGLLLSLTAAVKVATPLVVGVPEMAPVDARLSPAGRLPEATDHL
jgi:hypothetical protein